MRRQAFLAALLVGFAAAPLAAQGTGAAPGTTTTLIFVRHAEAGAGDPQDPTLTPAGEARAQALLKALSTAGVSAVYTSEFQRTQQTGGVVAKALSVTTTVVPVRSNAPGSSMPASASLEDRAKEMIARILREQNGRTSLIVGHSNTVPMMVNIASGETIDAIADTEYDHMYIVTIRDGVAHVVKARY